MNQLSEESKEAAKFLAENPGAISGHGAEILIHVPGTDKWIQPARKSVLGLARLALPLLHDGAVAPPLSHDAHLALAFIDSCPTAELDRDGGAVFIYADSVEGRRKPNFSIPAATVTELLHYAARFATPSPSPVAEKDVVEVDREYLGKLEAAMAVMQYDAIGCNADKHTDGDVIVAIVKARDPRMAIIQPIRDAVAAYNAAHSVPPESPLEKLLYGLRTVDSDSYTDHRMEVRMLLEQYDAAVAESTTQP